MAKSKNPNFKFGANMTTTNSFRYVGPLQIKNPAIIKAQLTKKEKEVGREPGE